MEDRVLSHELAEQWGESGKNRSQHSFPLRYEIVVNGSTDGFRRKRT